MLSARVQLLFDVLSFWSPYIDPPSHTRSAVMLRIQVLLHPNNTKHQTDPNITVSSPLNIIEVLAEVREAYKKSTSAQESYRSLNDPCFFKHGFISFDDVMYDCRTLGA